ncbi:hypothetical protein [Clostridium kluyveri]|uniref:hypothetical protein n=1 Tax=Clostridium kluyveri TaxID=1534 RepID=UPI002245EC7E|nr:hypothetical protein [Clostridium kluyveri]UZQ49406.1 hypothetical protein OP486_15810 [Clostridium kluyveri]
MISIVVFILKRFSIKIFKNSLNESIKYINKVPYMEVIIGNPIITITIVVKIIIIIVWTPKYMGRSRVKKTIIPSIMLKSICFFILRDFLAIVVIPKITKNISGISLKKISIK